MANVHLHIPSFNAGELSPLLGARFAVEKVGSGCRKLRNFIPHVHGPAFRRPGMEYMGAAAGNDLKSSLRGFNFSTSTGFILELHPDGLQVWSNGEQVELVNEVALPYSESECAEVQMAQVNDVVYLAHPGYMPRKLVRYADDDWRIEDIDWTWPALGDENVRSDEIATPTVTPLLSEDAHTWEEYDVPAATLITLDAVNPDLTATTKTARFQRLVDGAWQNVITITWTTAPPTPGTFTLGADRVCRITFDGPDTATSEVTANWGATTVTLDTGVPQPASIQAVTVNGEWQVHIDGTSGTIPTGASPVCKVQKLVGATWTTIKTLTPIEGEVVSYRGPNLSTSVRLNWTGREFEGGTVEIEGLVYPTADSIELSSSHETGEDRTLTATDNIFQEGHVGSFWQIVHRRDSSYVSITRTAGVGPAGAAYAATDSASLRVQGSWDVFTYGSWDGTLYLEKYVNGEWETLRSWESEHDRNVIANGTEEQEVELRLRVSAGNGITTSTAANPRFMLEAADARVYGLVKITAIGAVDSEGKATTATIDILTTLHDTTATSLWTEGAWSDVKGFPRAVAIHGQRLWFGGTTTEPLRLWGSVASDFENFRRSTYDDASVSFTPAAQQSNAMQWLASHGEDLIVGTSGDEWTLAGGVERGPITPTSVLMQRRSGYGSKYLPALLLGEVVAFVQRGGKKLRQVAPRADGIVWSAADLTVLAEHLTRDPIIQTAAMSFPFSILWAVTTSGDLLGMTFEQEQNVFAWHRHITDGTIESVAVVQGSEADEVWLSVLRNGQRNIERLDPEVFALNFSERERLIYSDGAVRFEFEEATTELTGLDHLEGLEVIASGDGADAGTYLVSDGAITLTTAATVAVVGLAFTSELQPMRMDIPMRDGTAQHRPQKANRLGIYVHESLGGEMADGEDGVFDELNYRQVSDPMDSAPPLFTGNIDMALEARTRDGIDAMVRTSGPLPLNIGSFTIFCDAFGGKG